METVGAISVSLLKKLSLSYNRNIRAQKAPVMATPEVVIYQNIKPNKFHGDVFEDGEDWDAPFERAALVIRRTIL